MVGSDSYARTMAGGRVIGVILVAGLFAACGPHPPAERAEPTTVPARPTTTEDTSPAPTITAAPPAAAPTTVAPTTTTTPPTTAVPRTTVPTPTRPPATAAPAQSCTPGYDPCIPPGDDVDCAGGGGNGPRYVTGPVKVTGSDPYGLDRDHDGVGCE